MEESKKNLLKRSNSLFMYRAIRVKFFRNGDKYFTGFTYPISFNRYKDFDILLKDLSASSFCNKSVMPCGVRCIFDITGNRINNIHQMEESNSYVCSGSNAFISLDYVQETTDPKWKTTKCFVDEVVPLAPLQNRFSRTFNAKSSSRYNSNRKSLVRRRTNSAPFKLGAKIINLVRNSTGRPRKVFQWLLNTKSAPTFNKVLDDFSSLIKLDAGFVKHVFFPNGREVTSLRDFFGDESTFIAVGTELVDRNSLELTPQELSLLDKLRKPCGSCVTEVNGLQRLTDKYLIGNQIGVGSYAVVKECRDKRKKQMVAVKIIDKKKCDKYISKVYQEIDIIKKLRHTNVIELLDSYETIDFIYLVMDLSQEGNMVSFLLRTQSYSEQDLSGMIHNISSGLLYLHSIQIIHRDIKFENILIDKDMSGLMRLKICDFGLSLEVEGGKMAKVVCGSPYYMAPEIFTQEGYSYKVDIWSLGVLFHVLLSGSPPFTSKSCDFNEVFDKILQTEVDYEAIRQWENVSEDAKNLLCQMLSRDVSERFSASQVLSSPWVAEDNIAANVNLWPLVANSISDFLKSGEAEEPIYQCDFLARTSLDKDSNFFESDE